MLAIVAALPWVLKVAAAAIAVMGTVTFVSFLYEEALQTVGMGVYIAISNKQWSAAAAALEKARRTLAAAKFFYTYFGWLAPYSMDVFSTYANATEAQYAVYDKVIKARTGAVADPAAAGKVFNVTGFKINATNGTRPAVSSLVAGEIKEEIIKVPEEKVNVTSAQQLWDIFKTFYVGRMYMSKKELAQIEAKYNLQGEETASLLDDVKTYYPGRMYMSKKEMAEVAKRHGLV